MNFFCVSQGDPHVMDEHDLLEQQKRVRKWKKLNKSLSLNGSFEKALFQI